jgi:hypothetical protein
VKRRCVTTLAQGIKPFFQSNPASWFGSPAALGVEAAAYYSTAPLATLVDVDYLNTAARSTWAGAPDAAGRPDACSDRARNAHAAGVRWRRYPGLA